MTKKWTCEEYEFALNSAWSAFENTLRTHGLTEDEIKKFKCFAVPSMVDVGDYLEHAITWKEEEWV